MKWRSRTAWSVVWLTFALMYPVEALPASYVVLPISSFASSTSLIAAYNCAPTYASTACSGHGSCYLLLDATAASSLPYLNTSTAAPLASASSALDAHGIDTQTPLPAAVCICDSGWTGRGDYINHYALDGDSCGISRAAIHALSIIGIAIFIPLLLLAIQRLYLWSIWHTATLHDSAILGPTSPDDKSHSSPSDEAVAVLQHSKSTSFIQLPRTHPRVQPVSTVSPKAASSNSPNLLSTTAPIASNKPAASTTTDKQQPQPLNTNQHHNNNSIGTTERYRRTLWKAHLSHITFLHPLCSLLFAISSLVFFGLRLSTELTVGVSYGMSVLVYVNHVPYICCVTMGVANTLQVCGAIVGRQRPQLLSLIGRARRYLGLICVYGLFSFVTVFVVRRWNDQQQLMAQLVLLLCWAPDMWLLGPLSIGCFMRLLPALIADMDKLSAEQQATRVTIHNKLRSFCYLIGFLLVGNTIAFLILAISSSLRQTGLPIYVYFWYYSSYGFVIVRLILLQPPKASQPQSTAAVSPIPASNAGLREKAARLAVEALALTVAEVGGGGGEAADAGLGGWTERSRHPPARLRAATSSRIEEGHEGSSKRATASVTEAPGVR